MTLAPYPREEMRAELIEFGVQSNLHDGLIRYLFDRIRTGDFLYAVLSNDLQDAIIRAAPGTDLRSIVLFLINCAPGDAWGSRDTVDAWLSKRDARGT